MSKYVYEKDWDSNGFTIKESRKGWIYENWNVNQGCFTGVKIFIPFDELFPKGTDFYLTLSNGEVYGDSFPDHLLNTKRKILRKGHKVQ